MPRPLPSGTVTLLFTDIEGSTRLLDGAGPEYGALLADHRRVLRGIWDAYGGVEVDTQGDAFLVAFADPRAALRAAADAVRGLARHDWRGHPAIKVRIGVHTGTPELGEEGYWGPDLHYGARLGAAAHGGQVLVSASTASLVRDATLAFLGEHALKDFPKPTEVHQLVVDGIGPEAFPSPRWLDHERLRLPTPATELVGREREVARLTELLAEHSLVTLVGPGGSGKTRLALEVAREVAHRHEDAWFVPLESTTAAEDVVGTLVRVLGIAGEAAQDEAVAYLARRSALLVLDNAEHVLGAAPLVRAVAAAGPGIRVLVTSQAPLRVAGEQVMRLEPLAPEHALRLLQERASEAGVPVAPADEPDLRELTRRLEGMPLAIELAAPRLAVGGPQALLRQLDRGLDALGTGGRDLPERQRGLRAMLDWTCGLLTDGECDLLAGLSAFAEDVDPVLVEDAFPGAFDAIASLLDVGLVSATASRRLALRPPVRRYAAELVDGERRGAHRRRVVRVLADLGRRFEPRWLIEAATGHRVLGPEEANILAALEWAREHDPDGHADLVAATSWWMTHQNHARIGRPHADLALERATDPVLRARLLQARGVLALDESDPTMCLAAAEAWAALGEVGREVISLAYGANLMVHAETDLERAVEISYRAVWLAETQRPQDRLLWFVAADMHAQALYFAGRRDEGRELAGAAMDLLDRTDDTDPWRRFFATTLTADIALNDGDPGTALPLYTTCIELTGVLGSASGQLLQACSVGECLLGLGRTEDVARVAAVCEHVNRELGLPLRAFLGTMLDRLLDRCDPALLSTARSAVRGWGVDAAIAEVVQIARRAGETPVDPGRDAVT